MGVENQRHRHARSLIEVIKTSRLMAVRIHRMSGVVHSPGVPAEKI